MPHCQHCKAKRFFHETNNFCCADGSISLVTNDVPDQLYNLFVSNTAESTQFRTYVRTYNNKFAFTSFGVKFDRNLCRRNRGIYTFRAQGQIYHYLPDLIPSDGQPSNLQLYFYDIEHEFENRIVDSIRMDPSIIAQLMDLLRVNPYSTFFRSIGDLPNLEYQKICIKSDPGLDQRVFNAPTSSEVAAIWVENDDSEHLTPRDIFVFNHVGGSHLVQYYFGCYDPLQYPLLFPLGDIGWHQGIQRINKRIASVFANNCTTQLIDPHQSTSAEELLRREEQVLKKKRKDHIVSCREYYCYKLQIRENLKSILLISGRLLQQFVVDMYIKIETSRAKLEDLKYELFKREIFGKISAYVYVIEHQKRGLPHAHFLIILRQDWKLYAPESFDEIVSAELPDKDNNLHLYTAVIKHMMHGPCGVLNPTNVCMKKHGCCKNNYPKQFVSNTVIGNDCFPIYKRCNNGRTAKIRGHDLDNRWVVPYNPYLLAMFDCHIYVEICSTIKAVKYLYQYIYKGHDRVAFNLVSEQSTQQIDEIERFQSARWITPPEAMWRIFGFIINEVHPAVYSLHLHLENSTKLLSVHMKT
ncbi:uncharacterized protein LOC122278566 [Carya illinoinensis]|uniref:uncharacterized protein LOC122278566 n=1 Tax=Carya illinoinensis TaxID=32201 RepID=UPI001C71E768|nr:uncharacterized protein LOC122278566 [Carya illinoinensis]